MTGPFDPGDYRLPDARGPVDLPLPVNAYAAAGAVGDPRMPVPCAESRRVVFEDRARPTSGVSFRSRAHGCPKSPARFTPSGIGSPDQRGSESACRPRNDGLSFRRGRNGHDPVSAARNLDYPPDPPEIPTSRRSAVGEPSDAWRVCFRVTSQRERQLYAGNHPDTSFRGGGPPHTADTDPASRRPTSCGRYSSDIS